MHVLFTCLTSHRIRATLSSCNILPGHSSIGHLQLSTSGQNRRKAQGPPVAHAISGQIEPVPTAFATFPKSLPMFTLDRLPKDVYLRLLDIVSFDAYHIIWCVSYHLICIISFDAYHLMLSGNDTSLTSQYINDVMQFRLRLCSWLHFGNAAAKRSAPTSLTSIAVARLR